MCIYLDERKLGTARPRPDKGVKKNQMIILETGSPQAAWLKTIRARRRTKKKKKLPHMVSWSWDLKAGHVGKRQALSSLHCCFSFHLPVVQACYILYKVGTMFDTMDKILNYDHSNERC